jgi:hypothetical protein
MTAGKRMFFRSSKSLSSLSFFKIASFRASASFWHIIRKGEFGEVCPNGHEIPLRPTQGIDKLPRFFLVTMASESQLSSSLAMNETNGRMTEGQNSSDLSHSFQTRFLRRSVEVVARMRRKSRSSGRHWGGDIKEQARERGNECM